MEDDEQKVFVKLVVNEAGSIPAWISALQKDAIISFGTSQPLRMKPTNIAPYVKLKDMTDQEFVQTYCARGIQLPEEAATLRPELETLLNGRKVEIPLTKLDGLFDIRDACKLNLFDFIVGIDEIRSGIEDHNNHKMRGLTKEKEYTVKYHKSEYIVDYAMISSKDSLTLQKGPAKCLDITHRVFLANPSNFEETMKIPYSQKSLMRESDIFDFYQIIKAVIVRTPFSEVLFDVCDVVMRRRVPSTIGEVWSILQYVVMQEAKPTTILLSALSDYTKLFQTLQSNPKESGTVFQWMTRGPVHVCIPERKKDEFVSQLQKYMRERKVPTPEKDLCVSRKEATLKLRARNAIQPCQDPESTILAPSILVLDNPDHAYLFKYFMGPVIFVSPFHSVKAMWEYVEKKNLGDTSILYHDEKLSEASHEEEERELAEILKIFQDELRRLITSETAPSDLEKIIRCSDASNKALEDSVQATLINSWKRGVDGFDGNGKIYDFPLYRFESLLLQINSIYSAINDSAKINEAIAKMDQMIQEYCKRNDVSQAKDLERKYVPITDEVLWHSSRDGDLNILYQRALKVNGMGTQLETQITNTKNTLEAKLDKIAKRI